MKIYITPEAKQKLDLYVDVCNQEISGLGSAAVVNQQILIDDIYLLKQECSASDTELDQESVAEFLNELIKSGRDPESIKVWWHSHANMGAFWSSTDDSTAGKFGNGWMVSLVANKKGEYKCRLDVYEPVHLVANDCELAIASQFADAELRKIIEAEVRLKVSQKQWAGCYGNGGWGRDGAVGFRQAWHDDWEKTADGVWRRKGSNVTLTAEQKKELDDAIEEDMRNEQAYPWGWSY